MLTAVRCSAVPLPKNSTRFMRYTITDYYGDNLYGPVSRSAPKRVRARSATANSQTAGLWAMPRTRTCPLAFACVVEDSGFGATYAAPVAQAAMIQAAKSLGASAVTQ